MKNPFCIDSSSLMTAMRETYPIATFPGLWKKMGESFKSGELISTIIVYDEIEHGGDELAKWAEVYKAHFLKVEEELLQEVAIITTNFPTLIDHTNPREQADPYLIAMAKMTKGTVVTEERLVGENARIIKIPNVCKSLEISSIKLIQMIKVLNWKFH